MMTALQLQHTLMKILSTLSGVYDPLTPWLRTTQSIIRAAPHFKVHSDLPTAHKLHIAVLVVLYFSKSLFHSNSDSLF